MTAGRSRSDRLATVGLVAVIVVGGVALPAVAAKDDLALVSRESGPSGAGGDLGSSSPGLSADGRFVAFSSDADNLSGEDNDAVTNVFLRDTLAGTTTLVSRAPGPAGAGGDSGSFGSAISADGRVVAFSSSADNLSAEDNDAVTNIFLRDTLAGTTTLVSRAPGPGGAGGDSGSASPAVSADGRFVAFQSSADNLSAEDDNTAFGNIFLRDTVAGTTTLVSRAQGPGGAGGNSGSLVPTVSADGRFVAFASDANNLTANDNNAARDIFLRDTLAGTTTLVSRASGPGGAGGDSPSFYGAVSADGRFVAFESDADNLSAEDDNVYTNVFLRDTLAGTTTLVSRAPGPGGAGGDSSSQLPPGSGPIMSADARFVAFDSFADNLSAEDNGAGTNVFLRDTLAGTTTLVSRAPGPGGAGGDSSSRLPAVSADGRFVAFSSDADNLSTEDDNAVTNVFLRDVLGPPPPPPPPPPPRPQSGLLTPLMLNLSRTSVVGGYRGGRLKARLVLQGRSTLPGEAVIVLRRTRGPRVTGLATRATLRLRLRTAGPYTVKLRLPARLAPGRYALTASGVPIPGKPGLVSIDRPRLGILLRAFAGAALNAPARVLPGTTRRLLCAFDFALVPAGGLVTTEWRGPGGSSPRSVRPRAARVVGFAVSRPGRTLASGRYTCILRVRGTKVGAVSVRVRELPRPHTL